MKKLKGILIGVDRQHLSNETRGNYSCFELKVDFIFLFQFESHWMDQPTDPHSAPCSYPRKQVLVGIGGRRMHQEEGGLPLDLGMCISRGERR
jgi:hypothetical protein